MTCGVCGINRHYLQYAPNAWLCAACAETVYGGHPNNEHSNEDLV